MKEIRGRIEGATRIEEDTDLHGTIAGNVTVAPGVTFWLSGTVIGRLELEPSSRVLLGGTLHGNAVNRGGHLEFTGTLYGQIVREGGETIVDPNAVIYMST